MTRFRFSHDIKPGALIHLRDTKSIVFINRTQQLERSYAYPGRKIVATNSTFLVIAPFERSTFVLISSLDEFHVPELTLGWIRTADLLE